MGHGFAMRMSVSWPHLQLLDMSGCWFQNHGCIMYFETTRAHAFDFTSEQILVVDSQGWILSVIKFPGFFPFHHIFSTYHLVMTQFAMERSTIF